MRGTKKPQRIHQKRISNVADTDRIEPERPIPYSKVVDAPSADGVVTRIMMSESGEIGRLGVHVEELKSGSPVKMVIERIVGSAKLSFVLPITQGDNVFSERFAVRVGDRLRASIADYDAEKTKIKGIWLAWVLKPGHERVNPLKEAEIVREGIELHDQGRAIAGIEAGPEESEERQQPDEPSEPEGH